MKIHGAPTNFLNPHPQNNMSTETKTELAKTADTPEAAAFKLIQRKAALYSSSSMVPAQYRAVKEIKEYGKVVREEDNPNALANCVIALNISNRMGADELMVMQNLYIVEGRPSWSSQWVIAMVNTCGKYSPLRFDITDLGEKEVEYSVTEWENGKKQARKLKAKIQNLQCIAWAYEKATGDRLEGTPVTMEMAVQEGWYGKNGSKWQTMPQMMLRYRAASFFGKLYAPELLMGLPTAEEIHDMPQEERVVTGREVPAAKVPDLGGMLLPSAPAPAADLTLSADEPSPSLVFWARIDHAGLNRDAVEEYLCSERVIEFPADFTDEIAAGLMRGAAFDAIVTALKGGAA